MIPYDMDPSLYTREPESPVLDDGFSPPHLGEPDTPEESPSESDEVVAELGSKSPF